MQALFKQPNTGEWPPSKKVRQKTLFDEFKLTPITWDKIGNYPNFSPVEHDITPRIRGSPTIKPSPVIGSGTFGTVYKTQALSGEIVAIKVVPYTVSANFELLEEMNILTTLHSKADPENVLRYIIRYYDAFTSNYHRNGRELYLVMEYLEGKDYETYFKEFDREASAEQRMNQAYQFAYPLYRAMSFFHSRGVVHRDIHFGNILIRADNTPVFIDFGLACGDTICDNRPMNVALGMLNEDVRMSMASSQVVSKDAWKRNDCTQLAMTILGSATGTIDLRDVVFDHGEYETTTREKNPQYYLQDNAPISRTRVFLNELAKHRTCFFPGNMYRLVYLFTDAIKGIRTADDMVAGMRLAIDALHGPDTPVNFLTLPADLKLCVSN